MGLKLLVRLPISSSLRDSSRTVQVAVLDLLHPVLESGDRPVDQPVEEPEDDDGQDGQGEDRPGRSPSTGSAGAGPRSRGSRR